MVRAPTSKHSRVTLMDTAMEFELAMRLLFGEKAYHIASSASHPAHRREWLH
jgi:hypothetical protein